MQIHEENNDFGKMIDEKMEAVQADTMKWLMPPSLLAAYHHCNMLLNGKFRYGEDYNEFEKSFIQDYAHDVLDMIWIFSVIRFIHIRFSSNIIISICFTIYFD